MLQTLFGSSRRVSYKFALFILLENRADYGLSMQYLRRINLAGYLTRFLSFLWSVIYVFE